ncbi:MAG: PIG-L deacetylase family protein [Acidimicrobiales bacterium]
MSTEPTSTPAAPSSAAPKPLDAGADGTTAPVVFGSVAASCSVNLDRPASVLAIGAHPDDIEFGCGATLAKWAAAGSTVHHLVCTDGSKGTWDAHQDPAELVMLRQGEQRRAAAALGGTGEVVFLGWTDGELDSGLRQRWEVAYWIRRLQPVVVIGHDPWKRYRLHPDHRHAGLLTVESIVAARDPLFFPEQNLAPHRPSALLLFEADEVDHIEDVTGFADTKFAGLFAHESQFRSTMKIDATNAEGSNGAAQRQRFVDRITDRLAQHGAVAGFTHGEAYKLISQL